MMQGERFTSACGSGHETGLLISVGVAVVCGRTRGAKVHGPLF